MNFFTSNILTFAFVLPLLGALAVSLMPKRATVEMRITSLAFSLASMLIAVVVITMLQNTSEFQFTQATRWIPQLGIAYRVGVDGTSTLLVLMTTIVTTAIIASSAPTTNDKAFLALILVAEAALIGSFIALDVFLFFVCSELLLVPFFFIIGMGGTGTSRRSAITYAVITLIGSAFLFVAMIAVALQNGGTFDLITWYAKAKASGAGLWLFGAFALPFLIRMAIVPFHTWLADACADAPSGGMALIVATLAPLGAYGLFRFAVPLFPLAAGHVLPVMLVLAVTSIIYGGLNALAQDDTRRFIAFASIVSSGMMLLGIFAFEQNAAQGATLQMLNHGVVLGTFALLIGMVGERINSFKLDEFGGIARIMPFAATAVIGVAAASAGLPVFATFVGWFLILLGSFQTNTTFATIATGGLVIVCAYTFRFLRRSFFGQLRTPKSGFIADLDTREIASIAVLFAIILAIGVWPQPWLSKVARSTDAFLALAERGIPTQKVPSMLVVPPEPKLTPLKAPPSRMPMLRVDTAPAAPPAKPAPRPKPTPVIEHKRVTLPPLPHGAGEDDF